MTTESCWICTSIMPSIGKPSSDEVSLPTPTSNSVWPASARDPARLRWSSPSYRVMSPIPGARNTTRTVPVVLIVCWRGSITISTPALGMISRPLRRISPGDHGGAAVRVARVAQEARPLRPPRRCHRSARPCTRSSRADPRRDRRCRRRSRFPRPLMPVAANEPNAATSICDPVAPPGSGVWKAANPPPSPAALSDSWLGSIEVAAQ